MSKFRNGRIYIIIDDEDITTDMVNFSTSMSKDTMPSKTSGGILKRIIEIIEPASDIFSTYTWYDVDSINAAWDALP